MAIASSSITHLAVLVEFDESAGAVSRLHAARSVVTSFMLVFDIMDL